MSNIRTFHWNGTDLPDELRALPAGTYVVDAIEPAPRLTSNEENRIEAALASLRADRGRTLDQVRQTIELILLR